MRAKLKLTTPCQHDFACVTCREETEIIKTLSVKTFIAMQVAAKIMGETAFYNQYGPTWASLINDCKVIK